MSLIDVEMARRGATLGGSGRPASATATGGIRRAPLTLVSGGESMPGPVQDALESEGATTVEAGPAGTSNAITTCLFRPGADPAEFALAELPRLVAADENFAWVDLTGYARQQMAEVARAARLHHEAVHLAVSPWQRPQLDVYQDHFHVSATVPRLDGAGYKVQAGQLDLFFGPNFLVSAHKQALPFGDRVAGRAHRSPELVQLDSAYMLFIMLDELLAYYESQVERVEDEIEAAEERAIEDTSDRFLHDLLRLKRYVFALARLAEQHRDIFSALLRPDFPFIAGGEVEGYFRDLELRLAHLLEALLAAKEAVNGAFDLYVSHMSHRTNGVMKTLTMVSTVLLPTSVILGLFGTQFPAEVVPLYHQAGFVAMLVAIVALTVGLVFAFRRRGWF